MKETVNIELLETLLNMGEYKQNDPIASLVQSYGSLSQEIDKYNTWGPITIGDVVHYHRGDLLQKLYPMCDAKPSADGTQKDVYNLLTTLLKTGETLPSVKNVPEKSLLQFSDFTEIDHTARTLTMPLVLFNKKKLKFISYDRSNFNMKEDTRVLFVESTEQHKGSAIPFMLSSILESTSNTNEYEERYQSPKMFNNNTAWWTIKLISK
jgi:hypothetical protein